MKLKTFIDQMKLKFNAIEFDIKDLHKFTNFPEIQKKSTDTVYELSNYEIPEKEYYTCLFIENDKAFSNYKLRYYANTEKPYYKGTIVIVGTKDGENFDNNTILTSVEMTHAKYEELTLYGLKL